MTKTQTISVRDLRENLSLYLRATQITKVHFVVKRHSEILARIVPEKPKKKTRRQLNQELLRDLQEARAQAARGEMYTSEEVRTMLGLPPGKYSGQSRRSKK